MAEDFVIRIAEVLVEWPLYRPFRFSGNVLESRTTQGDSITGGPRTINFIRVPSELSMQCSNCGQQERWDLQSQFDGPLLYRFQGELAPLEYRCKSCGTGRVTYFLLLRIDEDGGDVTKVGQYPPLEREPSKILASAMTAADLIFYRHALTCRNSAFGIGAVAYLRRIVENRINYLLELVADAAKADNPDLELVKRLTEMKGEKRFAEKIDYAAAMLPKSIRRGGHNPIAALHELTSEGLHSKSDEECVEIFDRCRLAFEHVIKRLKESRDEDAAYDAAMKALAGKNTGKRPT